MPTRVEVTCVDESGTSAVLFVDLEAVSSEDELRDAILAELEDVAGFDSTKNFVVLDWDSLAKRLPKP